MGSERDIMSAEQNEKDLETLRGYSARNIERLRKSVGPDAAAKALQAIQKTPVTLGFFHETDKENIPLIQKTGAIYSYETLREKQQEHKAGMTYAETRLDETFNAVSHKPDPYRQFVYMRPVFNDVLNNMSRTGFLLPPEKIDNDIWMSFVDPNQQTSRDKESIEWGMTVSKSFDTSDVYVGTHMAEAVALKAMLYIGNADTVTRIKTIAEEKDDTDFRTYLDEFILDYDSMEHHEDCAYNTYRAHSHWYGNKIAEAGIHYNNLGVASAEILARADFDELYAKTLTAVFKDISKWGQVAKLEEVSVKDASVFIYGQPQKETPAPLVRDEKKPKI